MGGNGIEKRHFRSSILDILADKKPRSDITFLCVHERCRSSSLNPTRWSEKH